MSLKAISATPEAKVALSRILAEHGDFILHLTGGWCALTPLVLLRGDLKLGSRDVLFGTVEGVPIYKMPILPGASGDDADVSSYVLNLVDGMPIGFSIEAAPGKHFMLSHGA